ncbi:phage protein [hydrocarbon metagenome]|uniref:Phage protein n=1 Tax=hydrocarbon metagenome TaxID=938273 RepID=A0A0W8EB10_9ZZZZ
MDVLLSIKPKYVKSIINGEKRYEFRRTIFKNRDINQIYIYSSFPIKKIVATFMIGDILEDHPIDLWENVKDYAGIDREVFFSYFKGKSKAFAIEIQDLHEFDEPIDPWTMMRGFVPPQSYCYLNDTPMAK